MSLSKTISLTVNDYDIKLSSNIKFYQNDQLKLIFEINEYGIEVANGVKVKALMPVTPLSGTLFIETPLGVDSIESMIVENNTLTFYLSSTQTQYVGVSRMQILLSDGDGCQVTLPPFEFEIRENIHDSEVVLQQVLLSDENNNIVVDENGNAINTGTQVSSQTYAIALSAEDETKTATSQPTKQIKDYNLKNSVNGTEDLLIQDNGITKRIKTSELIDTVNVDISICYTKEEVNSLLENKANVSHTHVIADITDLSIPTVDVNKSYVDTQLATKANKSEIPSLKGYATTEYVDQEVGKTNAQLSDKASILDLETERKRIDSFTKLKDGSTTGDAELIDARTVNGTTYDTLGSAIRSISKGESLSVNSVHISNLSEEFYSKTDNEIRIVKATIDNTDFNFSLNNDYLHLSGKSNNAVNIVLYVDKPKLTVGNHHLKFFTTLASNVVTLEFTFSDGSFIKNFMNNSNVSTLVLDCEKTLEKIRIGIAANTRVSFENYIKLSTSPTGGYTPKYESKILTTNNVSPNPFKGKKWVCIGDSITYGYYTTTEGRAGRYQWQEEVANKLEMTFVNLGVSGSTTAGFLQSKIVDNIPSDVDIISVMGGTNDYGQNVNPNDVEGYEYNTGTYPGSIRLVIKYLVENFPNAKIIFCNCIGGGHKSSGNQTLYQKNKVNKTFADYAKICIDTANELSIPCIDLFSESGVNLLNRSTMISDNVHPTIEGYKRISEVYIDNFERYKVYLTSTI